MLSQPGQPQACVAKSKPRDAVDDGAGNVTKRRSGRVRRGAPRRPKAGGRREVPEPRANPSIVGNRRDGDARSGPVLPSDCGHRRMRSKQSPGRSGREQAEPTVQIVVEPDHPDLLVVPRIEHALQLVRPIGPAHGCCARPDIAAVGSAPPTDWLIRSARGEPPAERDGPDARLQTAVSGTVAHRHPADIRGLPSPTGLRSSYPPPSAQEDKKRHQHAPRSSLARLRHPAPLLRVGCNTVCFPLVGWVNPGASPGEWRTDGLQRESSGR